MSLTEQEKEIKDLIKRAKGSPDRKGAFRRDALSRLIGLIHSPYPSLKILAAGNIRHFFSDFPELEEAAINAVYDLCEDQSPKVRLEGYAAITQISKSDNHWIKRNADVLLQLLQSDEPDEVLVVKAALSEHLDMDPKITLGVLCDQIIPAEDSVDDEEKTVRDHLRSIVLSFITGEAKRAIIERHAVPGSAAEEVIANTLQSAIPRLDIQDVQIVINDILLCLAAYKTRTSRGQILLNTLLLKVTSGLQRDFQLSKPAVLKESRPYLEIANALVTTRHIAPFSDLLRFYYLHLTSKTALQKLVKDDQVWIICSMAEVLASCDSDASTQDGPQLAALKRQAVDASPYLIEIMCKSGLSDPRSLLACLVLLRVCHWRKIQTGWTVPANLINVICGLSAKLPPASSEKEVAEIEELIKILSPSIQNPASTSKLSTGTDASYERPLVTPKRRLDTSSSPLEKSANVNSAASLLSTSVSKLDTEPPAKKFKDGDSSSGPPSLLSRIESISPQAITSTSAVPSSSNERRSTQDKPNDVPPGGQWSIKGAAKSSNSRLVKEATSHSLLDRLSGASSTTPEDRESGNRRRQRKGRF